ncbi:MAG: DUF6932 family protein [Actinomycetota bacterium]
MIPDFDEEGNLPPGVHWASFKELTERFASNEVRREQMEGLMRAARELKQAGCKTLYVDESFITAKETPADFDACWDADGVDGDLLDPILLIFDDGRAAQKAKYAGELFPDFEELNSGQLFSEFFQTDKDTGGRKGIIAIDLEDWDQ